MRATGGAVRSALPLATEGTQEIFHPIIGGTDGAARGELSSLKLSRVATEVDHRSEVWIEG